MDDWEVQSSDPLLHRLLDNLFHLIGVLSLDGTLVRANSALFSAVDQARDNVLGRKIWDLSCWSDSDFGPKVRDAIAQVAAGESIPLTTRMVDSAGREQCLALKLEPMRDEYDRISHLAFSALKATDLILPNGSQRESEERYRHLVSVVDQGFCVMEILFDEQGQGCDYRFLEVNPAFERHTGLVNAVGRTAREMVPDLEPLWPRRYGRVALTGKPESFVEQSEAMGRWFEVDAFRIGEPEKRQIALLFTDISQRKAAEEALRESEVRFRTLADHMSQFAWMADPEGWIFWYNRRWYEYTGTTLEQMQGWGWRDVHHPDHVERVVEKIRRCFDSGEIWEDTFPLRSASGEYRWFLSRAVPIRDDQGAILRWFGTNTDITQQRELESQLQQTAVQLAKANQRKDEFLANVSHEIRSPMTAILGYLELITVQTDEDHQHIQTIRRNSEFLLAIINDILDLSKIEAGQFEVDSVRFAPADLIREIVELMMIRAEENGNQLVARIHPEMPATIVSDSLRIRQILINLVGNAIKFTEQGSVQIVASFQAENDLLSVEVIDTGIGIAEVDLERLFQPFEQVNSSNNRRFGGTGLGLAICRRLATALGGDVKVTSKLGQGSHFQVVLPVQTISDGSSGVRPDSSAADRAGPSTVTACEGQNLNLRIMIVDDQRDIRYLLQKILEKFGCQVTACDDGEAALNLVQASAPDFVDLIIMDMQMPGMDGLTTVQAMRSSGYRCPVLALTANAMNTDREACLNAGYTDFLSKPIDKSTLFEKLVRYS